MPDRLATGINTFANQTALGEVRLMTIAPGLAVRLWTFPLMIDWIGTGVSGGTPAAREMGTRAD